MDINNQTHSMLYCICTIQFTDVFGFSWCSWPRACYQCVSRPKVNCFPCISYLYRQVFCQLSVVMRFWCSATDTEMIRQSYRPSGTSRGGGGSGWWWSVFDVGMNDVRRLQAIDRHFKRHCKLRMCTSYRPCGGPSMGRHTGLRGPHEGHLAFGRRERR